MCAYRIGDVLGGLAGGAPKTASMMERDVKKTVTTKSSKPVPLVENDPPPVRPDVVAQLSTPMDLPHELDLLQVLHGEDKRIKCVCCGGSGDETKETKAKRMEHQKSSAAKAAAVVMEVATADPILVKVEIVLADSALSRNAKARERESRGGLGLEKRC